MGGLSGASARQLMATTAGPLIELSVHVDGEAAEAVCELFDRLGGGAVVEVTPTEAPPPQVVVRTYLAADDVAARARVEEGLWHLGRLYPIPDAAVRELARANWAEAWKEHFAPVRAGERFLIVPTWWDPEPRPGDRVIRLDPGMAFGTGLHPTTRLCLAALERQAPGFTCLDVGTGSGILSIGASLCGAGHVVALDIDDEAVAVARENLAANGAEATLAVGSLEAVPPGAFDVVLANLLAPILESLAPGLAARVAPGGHLIASGLLDTQVDEVTAAFARVGLALARDDRESDWSALDLVPAS